MDKDPILEESRFCEVCEPEVMSLVGYVRDLENTHIVAKQALETMEALNNKLTKRNEVLTDTNQKLKVRLEGKEAMDLKQKMDKIDNAHLRIVNKERILN